MNKKYIRRITRRLQCSGQRRAEIRKQLMSDYEAALENGEKDEDIIRRMGTPAEIADEFNAGFSPAEKKKNKREKWLKWILIIVGIIVIVFLILSWFMPKSTDIEKSRFFEKDEVISRTEEIIGYIGDKDYEALKNYGIPEMNAYFTADFMEQIHSYFGSDWGAFLSFGNPYIVDTKQMGKHHAVIQVNASYENASITFTLQFDADMRLEGLWVK